MTSSGIKRGLAVSAISALAVAGLPSLATSASAAAGDVLTVGSVGPTLDGGTIGGVVVLKTKNITNAEFANLKIFNSGLSSTNANSPTQTVAKTGGYAFAADGSANDSAKGDGFDEVTIQVTVTTPAPGSTAAYALVVDDNNDGAVQADEARTQVSQSTSGPLTSIDVTPLNQTTPSGVKSGNYAVTLRDGAGRTTQLNGGQSVSLTPDAGVTVTETGANTVAQDANFTAQEARLGTDGFTATPPAAPATGVYQIKLAGPGGATTTATLNAVTAAAINAANLNIVTPAEADTWRGFGSGANGGNTQVRVDQNMITFNLRNLAPNSNVTLKVAGTGVTFGGNASATYTTNVDANGVASIPVSPEAISDGDSFSVDLNGFTQTITFNRAVATTIAGATQTTFCKVKTDCVFTAVVTDQYGLPIGGGEVSARRTGPSNNDTAAQRKPVGADGTVSFTFTDAAGVNGGTDSVALNYYADSFVPNAAPTKVGTPSTIRYNNTGQGPDYVISLDANSAEAPTYTADTSAIVPLYDTVAGPAVPGSPNEGADIGIVAGEPNQQVTLAVDNGALILTPGATNLSQGVASVSTKLDNTGTLPAGYQVIGTKSGLVTLTIASGNRTETAALTVKAQTDGQSARNVTLSAPATVPSGTNQVPFTAAVTDAFGNPVQNALVNLNAQVSGPGFVQDGEVFTDENGQVVLNVRLDDNAVGPVTVKVDGVFAQFGAQADRQTRTSTTNDGKGLPVSSSTASATTTVDEGTTPPPPVPPVDIVAKTKGRNNDSKADKVTIKVAPAGVANGATVKLYKVKGNKTGNKKTIVGTKSLVGNKAKFTVKDKNGNDKTRYFARVSSTDTSNAGRSNNRGLR